MISNLHVLIMAGGSGSRFWPRSRRSMPKQFLDFTGSGSLLEMTVERVRGICPEQNIWVLTRADLAAQTQEILPSLDPTRIIAEPEGRDTAPCLVYAGARVERVDADALLLVLPADHVIPDEERFRETIAAAARTLDDVDGLLTFGIRPTFPATGYGYVRQGDGQVVEVDGIRATSVAAFKEKPDLETARGYLDSGDYFWNAGIFLWRVQTLRDAIRACSAELAEGWERLQSLGSRVEDVADPETISAFRSLPKISIDYALLERADNVRVIAADFSWDDVGSWRALERYRDADSDGNIQEGAGVLVDSRQSTIIASGNRIVAGLGLDGLVVIDTPDALLVCPRDRVEEVKKLVDELRDRGLDEVL